MNLQIPSLKKCCLCLPLRRAVLIFGYIDWVYSFFMVLAFSAVFVVYVKMSISDKLHHEEISMALLFMTIHLFELVFVTVLLYGAHKRNWRLLRVYFYYGLIALPFGLLYDTVEIIQLEFMAHNAAYALVGFVKLLIQFYLLLMVRSSYKKMEKDLICKFTKTDEDVDGESCLNENTTTVQDTSDRDQLGIS